MSDLDQQLRDLFNERAATVGPPPPLPADLSVNSPTRRWTRRPQWLLVPAAALITGAVVIPVAMISQNAGVTAMPAQEAQAWAQGVCTNRPEEQTPSQDEVRGMTLTASAVCWWENQANLGDATVGLQSITALSPSQITDLKGFLTDAPMEQPTCSMIDSPPQVEYYVFLRDSDGQDYRINIPEPPCLGFEMTAGRYQSTPLVGWLNGVAQTTKPSIDQERPSEVTRRARALLGERFVDLMVGQDQASYIIGVLNLQDDEIDDLTARLERQVPLSFESRTVAASDVEELRQVIEQAFAADRQGVRAIGSNLQNGTVLVGVASDRIPTMAEVVADLLPGSQAISRTEDGSALVCSSDADPTEPCVVVKAIGLGELTD